MLARGAHELNLLTHLGGIARRKCLFARLRESFKECSPLSDPCVFERLQIEPQLTLGCAFAEPLRLLLKFLRAVGKLKAGHRVFERQTITVHSLGCSGQLLTLCLGNRPESGLF